MTETISRASPPPLPHERLFIDANAWAWGPTEARPREDAAPSGWRDRKPHPWRRYLARQFDTVVSGLLGLVVLEFGLSAADPELGARFAGLLTKTQGMLLSTAVIVVLATIGNAVLIGLSGTSIGKWMFGIKVLTKDGRPIGVFRAFVREVRVAVMGMGLGLPLLSLIAGIAGFAKLTAEGATGWDKAMKLDVAQRPNGLFQIFLGLVGFALLIATVAGLAVYSAELGRS